MRWGRQALYGAAFLILLSPVATPQLLAFPHSTQLGHHRVYSEAAISPQVENIVRNADQLAARSPIALQRSSQPIFLTDGGWRWIWLSFPSRSAFALSRPLLETIVVNRSDGSTDRVFRPTTVGRVRSLAGTLAHEMTHSAIRNHFGLTADWRYPAWLREGYCDYVAGGGSLTDFDAAKLINSGSDHPALIYWRGRKQVDAVLKRNDGNVDKLFASYRT